MEYKCPNCKSSLIKVGTKLICSNDTCDYICLCEKAMNNSQWYIELCSDREKWNTEVYEKYPTVIAMEYQRLYHLLKKNKLYGSLYKIKDIFEIILKLPTLILLNEFVMDSNRTDEKNRTINLCLSKMLSLGDWHSIAQSSLNASPEGNKYVTNILKDVLKIYNQNNIIKWRNDTLGHGALLFDDTHEFRTDMEKMIEILKLHFDKCKVDYLAIKMLYVYDEKSVELIGCNVNHDIFKKQGKIFFVNEDTKEEIKEFIIVKDETLYFFDSFCQWDKKTKMLSYLDAKITKCKNQFFNNLYKDMFKYVSIKDKLVDTISDTNVYLEEEEEVLRKISNSEKTISPSYLVQWVSEKIETDNKGVYLIQMERGMGKTTFASIVDPHVSQKNSYQNITTRVYYINENYSYKIETFENNLVDSLALVDDKSTKFRGCIPHFKSNNSRKQELCTILSEFSIIYKDKLDKSKILLIIDGVDEIPDITETSILDYIPNEDDLPNNIYILLTSRVESENTEYLNKKIGNIKFSSKLEVLRDNIENTNILKTYIKKNLNINDETIVTEILKKADNRFLYLRPIEYILRYKELDSENIFTQFMDILRNNYLERYFKQIINMLVILAIARDGLTLNEISYLATDQQIDFKTLAYLSDISCLLSLKRTYRGTVISLAHAEIMVYIIRNYRNNIDTVIENWIDDVVEIDLSDNVMEYQKYMVFNVLYVTSIYKPISLAKLMNENNFSAHEIYSKFAIDNISENDTHLLIRFLDDFIEVLEGQEVINNMYLVCIYLLRMEAYMIYAFGSQIAYRGYVDKAIELLQTYDGCDEKQLKISAYKMRSDYYRRVGNITKSMEDSDIVKKLMEDNSDYNEDCINRAAILHIQSINLKNIGSIDEALTCAFKAMKLVENGQTTESKYIYANILNNIGLCYKKMTSPDLVNAEKYISESIRIIDAENAKKGFIVDNTFNNKANLCQIYRRKGNIELALTTYTETINEIINLESHMYIVDGNQKALQYNGRANICRDFAAKSKDKIYYRKAEEDYIEALRILDLMGSDSVDIRFLNQIYLNMILLYENNLYEIDKADFYRQKYYNATIKLACTQITCDDPLVNDKILSDLADVNARAGYEFICNNDLINAAFNFKTVIDLIDRIQSPQIRTNGIIELYGSACYNRSNCLYTLLNKHIIQCFNKRKQGIQLIAEFEHYFPDEIIEGFNKALYLCDLSSEEKSQIYRIISDVQCEVKKNFDEAITCALKALTYNEKNADALFVLGNAYYEKEDYTKAYTYYSKSYILDPTNQATLNNIKLLEKMYD